MLIFKYGSEVARRLLPHPNLYRRHRIRSPRANNHTPRASAVGPAEALPQSCWTRLAPEHMTFNDINGLVQQNVQLRNKVHLLSTDLDKKDMELRESFQIELKRITDGATSRVEKVMKKSEEQAIVIESLHRSVVMYRKLCEGQQKTRSNVEHISNNLQDDGSKDLMVLFEGSQAVSRKAYEQVSERSKRLDEELTKLRTELVSLRSEHDKSVLEAKFAQDRHNGYMTENDHQRKEANSVSLRNRS